MPLKCGHDNVKVHV